MRSLAISLLAFALLCGPADAEQWGMSEIRECVKSNLDTFFASFSGTANCPDSCGECFASPLTCISECANKEAACGCAQAIPPAVTTVSECCTHVWSIFESACRRSMQGLADTVEKTLSHICNASDEDLSSMMGGEAPTALLAKTRSTLQEGAVAVLAGLATAAANHPEAGALLELVPQRAGAGERAPAAFVESHSMGSACLGMLEAIESEHAAGAEGEAPDLRAVAAQISQGAAGVLGRELPSLVEKVHGAMAAAWSEDGPGMDAEGICEVILRHHDGL